MAAIAKYVFVGGALTLVADYIKMHHIDWLVMNGGFVGFNIAAYELDKFKGKKTVRTFNSFSLSNFKEVGLSGFFLCQKINIPSCIYNWCLLCRGTVVWNKKDMWKRAGIFSFFYVSKKLYRKIKWFEILSY